MGQSTALENGKSKRNSAEIERLISDHIGLVRAIVRKQFASHRDEADLLQCGLIGLWEAARDWNGCCAFASFAAWCIRCEITDYIRSTDRRKAECAITDDDEDQGEIAEDGMIGVIDLEARITDAWPPESRERFVLTSILHGVPKKSIAVVLGVHPHSVQRIAVRAYQRIKGQDHD